MTFNEQERRSAAWVKLKAYLEERLEKQRKENDKNKDALETANLRGSIEEIKRILKLDTPAQGTE